MHMGGGGGEGEGGVPHVPLDHKNAIKQENRGPPAPYFLATPPKKKKLENDCASMICQTQENNYTLATFTYIHVITSLL